MKKSSLVYAHAWRSGKITVSARPNTDAIVFLCGPRNEVKRIVGVLSRHAYDGKTLLVPGIPEANTDNEALEALGRFRDLCLSRSNPERPVSSPPVS